MGATSADCCVRRRAGTAYALSDATGRGGASSRRGVPGFRLGRCEAAPLQDGQLAALCSRVRVARSSRLSQLTEAMRHVGARSPGPVVAPARDWMQRGRVLVWRPTRTVLRGLREEENADSAAMGAARAASIASGDLRIFRRPRRCAVRVTVTDVSRACHSPQSRVQAVTRAM